VSRAIAFLLIVLSFLAGSWCQANRGDVKTALSKPVEWLTPPERPTEYTDVAGRRYHLTQVDGGKVWVPVKASVDFDPFPTDAPEKLASLTTHSSRMAASGPPTVKMCLECHAKDLPPGLTRDTPGLELFVSPDATMPKSKPCECGTCVCWPTCECAKK
jgi:hypothetical protein